MKRNKITAVILSIVMSMSLMMPPVEVLADEATAPSETQKTETVETEEPKTTEKQNPKETEKQEPKETETQEPKETEKQESEESKAMEPSEPESKETDETKISETTDIKGKPPAESASTPKKNAVGGTLYHDFGIIDWTYEADTLTLSGWGMMSEFDYNNPAPWNEYRGNIRSVVFSGEITSIGTFAFYGCSGITSITIPNGVTRIRFGAFENCSSLTSITIPRSVSDIEGGAFYACFKLMDVYYYGTINDWNRISKGSDNEALQYAHIHYGAYSITVNSGMSDLAQAAEGTTVTVTANDASSGKVFDKWIVVSGKVTLKNETQKTTTFTMPAENVEVTATYKDVEYTIKVNNGSATPATATAGTVITLAADAAPSGEVFDKWTVVSGNVKFANELSSTTTFTMPAENVEVTATYKTVPPKNYIVKVNNGVATPSTSAPGLVVNVKANDAPAGTEFEKWEVVSGTVIFADSSSATTFFVMPAENVEITAKYKSSLSVKGKTATVKYSKLKKKNQSLDVSKVLTFIEKGQGQLSFAKVSGDSKILINKTTGNITVKKKLKKKTYTVKVKVMASGNESCNPSEWKTVTFKIKVK